MAVTAVRADDVVGVRQLLADTDRDGFLAGIQVGEAGDLAGLDLDVQALFELADRLHLTIGAQQQVLVLGHGHPRDR